MRDKIVHKSEKIIYFSLTIFVLLHIVFQIINLGYLFVNSISNYSFGDPNVINGNIFSTIVVIFFDILISIEILKTFKEYENNVEYKSKTPLRL